MSQIMKKWIGDHQIDSTKIDPSYTYKMQGLNIPVSGTFGIGVINPPVPEISNPSVGAIRLQSTAGGGRTYELNSDAAGDFNIKDINASANRLSITPSGVINISNAVIGTTSFSTLTVTGTASLNDATISGVSVTGNASINSLSANDATISGDTWIGSHLYAHSSLNIEPNTDLNLAPSTDLFLNPGSGNTTCEGNFITIGDATINGLLSVGDATVGLLYVDSIESSGNISLIPYNGGNGAVNLYGASSTLMSLSISFDQVSITAINETGGPSFLDITATDSSGLGQAQIILSDNAPSSDINIFSDTIEINGFLSVFDDAVFSGNLFVGADASVIGDVWMGSNLYTHLSLSVEPGTFLNLEPSTDLFLNPGSNLTTCYSDFTCLGEIRTNNLILGANVFQNSGAVINSGALSVNNGDIDAGQHLYVTKTAYITDTTTSHLYDGGDASIVGNVTMGSNLYTHGSLNIEPNTDLNLAPSTVLYLNPGQGDTTCYGNLTVTGPGTAIICTTGNIATAYDMSCGGALRGNGLWMNGYAGDTTDAVIGSRTFHFISGILTSIS